MSLGVLQLCGAVHSLGLELDMGGLQEVAFPLECLVINIDCNEVINFNILTESLLIRCALLKLL
jgi:hypothetical protein